ncbi:MAG TPA: carboxylating nicotinate-nucleotide diphosphorylase [Longimicrobiales bacterium]|nr:carboxylating nicotinate-nucleotide diphosphorylase [Longimicrobiales bacterium]
MEQETVRQPTADAGWFPEVPRVPARVLDRIIETALDEDIAWGDATTEALIPPEVTARADIAARAAGVVAGLPVAARVFRTVDPELQVTPLVTDGERVVDGVPLLRVEGAARSILMAERVALNFLQRLSGVATLTSRFVDAVEGTAARIVDTRKTTPGLRVLEKYAVRCGGGANHRMHLGDAVLVKDNHRAVLEAGGRSLSDAVSRLKGGLPPTMTVEVEVDTLEELEDVLQGEPDAVLLDNMSPNELRVAVLTVRGRAITEASGGVTLDTVATIAESGVDLISIGALTHSAPALDVALDWIRTDVAGNGATPGGS